MNLIEIEIENKPETALVTTKQLAAAFWDMNSEQQADFFHELAGVVKGEDEKFFFGEMQWLWMAEDIKKRSREAWEMFLAFSAFAFDYWPQKSSFREQK